MPAGASDKESVALEDGSDDKVVTTRSFTIRTVADALKKGEVDTAIWAVERFLINHWEVALKDKAGNPVVQTLWQVKVWLKRKVARAVELAASALWDRMRDAAPKLPTVRYTRDSVHTLLEISPFDVHFGKLAWGQEAGEDYDLPIAEKRFSDGFDKLLNRAPRKLGKILIPLGNDFLHIDTAFNTTGHGTQVDVDGRYPKLIETASMAMVQAVEKCRTIAPVEVIWVPGNHDPRTSWHIAQFLWAWFRNSEGVEIDHGSKFRKYVRFGATLLGFTHGNEEAHRDLPTIMASEAAKDWADTRFREWHLGHFHKAKKTHFAAGDTYGPCVVRVLPSMSSADAWHYKKGYVGGNRGAEAYLYEFNEGPVASYFASV